jgi:hypothetical protein
MRSIRLVGAAGLLLAAVRLYGPVGGPTSVAFLSQNSDLIVVGTAGSAVQSADTISFPLHVARVVKGGSAIAGTTIQVDWTAVPAPGIGSAVEGSGIWFLKNSPSAWALLPVGTGFAATYEVFFPAPAGPILSAYAYQPTASITDKVAAELGSAIESASGGGTELNLFFQQSTGLLDQLNSPMIDLLYQRMSASALPQEAIMGFSGLIRQGRGVALGPALALAPQLGKYPHQTNVMLSSIRASFRATDPPSVMALGQAAVDATNPSVPLREACAEALRAIHTPAALPYLAALLDDPDLNLQSAAVGGLSAFANGLPVQTQAGVPSLSYLQRPSSAPYQTQDTIANQAMGPQAYKRAPFWKTWWGANHAALGY